MSRIIKEMINDIQPRKSRISEETKHLNEELVYADINELDREMNYNSTLKQLLYTKAVELPDKYKYLIGEIYAEYEDVCFEHPACSQKNGIFYGLSGEYITKEEYNRICVVPDNPKTGIFISVAAGIVFVVTSAGIIIIAKKKRKFI